MLVNNERLSVYLESLVNNVFKILPLYEEKNEGVSLYVDSLLSELMNLDNVIEIEASADYISLLATLSSVKGEILKADSQKKVIRRELFKSIDIIKTMVTKLEEGG